MTTVKIPKFVKKAILSANFWLKLNTKCNVPSVQTEEKSLKARVSWG